ncbi:S1 family peptidase [Streptomyces sp. HNM0663]|uniref:S1 family peptidase n=1 Tax=Streptomyces chengmaiensis TaxID=3040919 RepID=A0ABT6HV10_9ACTN|nr:S1 family peptidase [Streptomyces chengmaiensis]MDH2392556.1 S1 family peptidase [Streptomyces chengmaiensis]
MRHARRSLQRITRFAAVGGLLCGGLLVTTAAATEPPARGQEQTEPDVPGPEQTDRPSGLGAGLVARLGPSRTAGTWIGADGRSVVAVTDEDAAVEVGRSGARAKVVEHSMSRLRSAVDALSAAPRVPGTAWSVDYASNRIVVQADTTVSSDDWSRMSRLAERIGGFVHMERTPGALSPRLNGADPVFSRTGRCSAGFNVTDGRRAFILTAGHCGPPGTAWFQDPQGTKGVGTTTAGRFPGSDFSLVAYGNADATAADNVVRLAGRQGVLITAAADPVVGQEVFRSGGTTGVRSGKVTALNATVNYPEGTVTGLIQTTACAEPGDSGGPLFAGGMALGVTSGGIGDCSSGGTTYFQPVTTAMEALGVRLAGTAGSGDGAGAASPPFTAGVGALPGRPDVPARRTGIVGVHTVKPGLAVMGVSLVVLVANGLIRSASDRRNYRRQYSQIWS